VQVQVQVGDGAQCSGKTSFGGSLRDEGDGDNATTSVSDGSTCWGGRGWHTPARPGATAAAAAAAVDGACCPTTLDYAGGWTIDGVRAWPMTTTTTATTAMPTSTTTTVCTSPAPVAGASTHVPWLASGRSPVPPAEQHRAVPSATRHVALPSDGPPPPPPPLLSARSSFRLLPIRHHNHTRMRAPAGARARCTRRCRTRGLGAVTVRARVCYACVQGPPSSEQASERAGQQASKRMRRGPAALLRANDVRAAQSSPSRVFWVQTASGHCAALSCGTVSPSLALCPVIDDLPRASRRPPSPQHSV
jgi:hypothetical protein